MKKILKHTPLIIIGLYLVFAAFAEFDNLSIYPFILGGLGFVILALTFLSISERSTGTTKKIFSTIAEFFSWFWSG